MNLYNLTHNLIFSLLKGKTLGGKYLSRKQIADSKTGRMKWVYKYKPMSQRGAHEVTGKTFEKKTGIGKEEHKSAVEKALQSGNRVSLHVLRDYPDLVQKYGMGKRLERADKIRAKVQALKADKVKNQTPPSENQPMETIKEPATVTPSQKMKALEGVSKIWNGTRAYFDVKSLADALDIQYEYKNGRLRGATIDGQEISASRALGLKDRLYNAKAYYDSVSDSIQVQGLDEYSDQIKKYIQSTIERRLKQLPAEQPKQAEQPKSQSQAASEYNAMSEEDKNAFINKLADEEKGSELLAIAADNEGRISVNLPEMKFQTEYQKQQVDKYRADLANALKKNLSFLDIFERIPQETPQGNEQLAKIKDNLNTIRTGIEKISNPSFFIQQQRKIQQLSDNTLIKMGRIQDDIESLAKAVNDESITVVQKEKAESNRKTDFSNGIEGGYDKGINVLKVKMKDGSEAYKIMSPYLPDLVSKIRNVKDHYYKLSKDEKKNAGIAPTFDGGSKAWYFGKGLSGQLENVLRDYLHQN